MPDSRRYVAAGTARTSGSWLARTIDAWYDVCARATATRCDSPTEISFGRRVARRARSNASSRSATRLSAGRFASRSGSATFSSTVRSSIRLCVWNTKPISCRRTLDSSDSRRREISRPAIDTEPRVGTSSPPRIERSVVFPLPFGPQTRTASSRPTSRDTPRSTSARPSYDFHTSRADRTGSGMAARHRRIVGRGFRVRRKVLSGGPNAEGLMASKGATRRKRASRPDDSPLTEPRYLSARGGESLARLAETGLAECRNRLGELVSTGGPRTIPNLLVPYDRLMLALQEVLSQTRFLFDVHPNPDLRKVADHWYQEAQRFATELSLNRPLYDAFTELDASGEDDETRYALEKILRDFRLSGVDRDEATRARVQALRDEITAIGQDFDRIIREDVRSISVDSPGELEGLPEDFVEGHAPGPDGKITLTTNYPDSIPVFRYARNADVRRRLQFEYLNRGHPANLEVLARLLAKRHELASVLGYESYAEYIVQDKMVRSATAVADFLAKVKAASAARAQEDVARLLERKRQDLPGATALDAWDPNYYSE